MNRTHLLNKGLLKFGQLIKSFFNSMMVKNRFFVGLSQMLPKIDRAKTIALLIWGILFAGHANLFAQHPAPSFNAVSYSFCEGDSLVFTLNGLPDPSGFPGGDVVVNMTWYLSTSLSCGTDEVSDVVSDTISSTSHTFNTGHALSYPLEDNGLLMITASIFDPLNAEGGQEIILAQNTCIPIFVNPSPVGSISPTNIVTAICEGNIYQVDFTATAGTGPYDLVINGFTFTGITSGETIDLTEGVHFTGSTANIDLTAITDTGGTSNCTTNGAPITNLVSPALNTFTTRGTLSADETICSNSTPANIAGTMSTGGTSVSYGWESSSDNGNTWALISGEATTDYAPAALTQDMWYRRIDTLNTGGVLCWSVIDTVIVTVNNITIGNTLTADEVVCEGQTPAAIIGTTSTIDGSPTYGWELSIDNGVGWSPIVGATGIGYIPPSAILVDTWYRRVDTSELNGIKCFEYMDTVKVFLNNFTTVGNFITGDEIICSGDNPSLILQGASSTGGDTQLTFGWQLTTDNGTTWSNIASATNESHDPPNPILIDTWYRRIDTISRMGFKCVSIVDTTVVLVNNITAKGSLSGDQAICVGVIPSAITGSISIGDGAISYGWEENINGGGWNVLPTETGTGLTLGTVAVDTWYRRIDTTNLGGFKCVEIVDTVKILVNNFITLGDLTNSDEIICAGVIPTAISGNPTTATGTVSYGWETNVNGGGWNEITGAAGIGYTPLASISDDTWYRRIDTSTINGFKCIEIVDTVKVTVNNFTTLGTLSADETICQGAMPTTITGVASTVDGTLTYGWAASTNALIFTPIVGATSIDYTPPALMEDAWYIRTDTTTLGNTQCYETVDTVKITVNNIAINTVLSADQSICHDEIPANITGIITATDGTVSHGWEYSDDNGVSWNLIAGATSLGYNPTTSIITDTWYRRVDTSDIGGVKCYVAVDTVVVTVNPKPVPLIAGTITEICVGNAIYLPFTVSGGSGVYTDTTWLTSDVTRATVSADGLITGIASGFSNISAVVTDANGCKDTSNHGIVILPLPVAGAITGANQVCMGDSITLTANPTGGNGGNTISWIVVNGTGSAIINSAGVLQPTSPGTIAVSYAVADNKTCSAISAFHFVTIDTIPTPVIVSNDTTICQGDMVEFTASGGTTYEFLVNNISQQGPAVYDTFLTNALNHNDMVRVVVANSTGCFDTSSVITMVVDTIPLATLVSDAFNNTKGIGIPVTFTASGGTTYEFSVNNVSQGIASPTATFTTSSLSHLDTVIVNVTDGNTCSDTASIVMNINDKPVALNDTIVILEDALFETIDVQANDADPEGDLLLTFILTQAVHGLNTTVNNNLIQYMPDPDFNGLDSITYWVCDEFNNCDYAIVYIIVQPVNDIPMANSDTLKITEDDLTNFVEVLANDTDPDGDSLNVTILTVPSKGTTFVVTDSIIAYTPLPDSSGVDVIAYEVCDTKDSCSVGILFIEIMPVNDRPVATKDSISILEDSMNVSIAILMNDFDADDDVITLDTVYPPTSGGTIAVTNDTVLYNPPANFNGLDSVKYVICDTILCDTTYLIINVIPVNEAPVAVKDSITITEDTSTIKIALLANDLEFDGETILIDSLFASSLGNTTAIINDTLCYTPLVNSNGIDSIKYIISDGLFKDSTYVIVNILPINDAPIAVNDTVEIPENANPGVILVQLNDSDPDGDSFITEIVNGPTNGVAVAAVGAILYTPPTSFNGLDTIEYRICDMQVPALCDNAFAFINVTGVNDAPVAINDTICIAEDTLIAIAVEINDFDIDGDPTTIQILTAPKHALIDSIRNDSIIYQPTANFNGLDSIQYQLFDGTLLDQAWVYITIKPRNDAPITVEDSITILEDAPNVQIAVTLNDSDIDLGDSLKVNVVTGPTSGGTTTILDDTIIVYTPGLNFFGLDTIVYQACDTSNVCTIDTVFVTVQSVNEPPIAVDDFLTINEDANSVVIDVQVNDSDGDGDTFTTTIISTLMMADTLNGDSIIVSAPTDFTGVQVVVYKICDALGLCDTGLVTITILPINDAPVANLDQVAVSQDTSGVIITPLLNDTDVDDVTLTIGTISTTANGAAIIIGTDSIAYTPLGGFSGIDMIQYTVCDTSNLCSNGLIIITVGFVNTIPVAVNDTIPAIAEDSGPAIINVLSNDSDIDGPGDSLKITMITSPFNGGVVTVTGDSTINYTPPLNFSGIDFFEYTVCDTSMGCATALVFFTITAVNDTPTALNDTVFLAKDTMGAQFAVLTNDSDIEGDPLAVSLMGNSTQNVTVSLSGDSITYSAPTGFLGIDSLYYKITDTGGLMDTAIVIIVITDPNNIPPSANPDFATTTPATPVNIDVQDNDLEPNGDNLITTIINGPKTGNTATVLNQDSLQFTPDIAFTGYDTIWYQVCDPSLTCDTSMAVILVENTLSVSARVILEGAYDRATLLMHDSLRTLNFIPIIEPYSTLPSLTGAYKFVHKNGGGNELITNSGSVLGVTGPNAIVDWVYLELLTATDTIPVASRSALIQRDGDIVDVDGVSPVAFELLPDGNYFLSIRHRNHLGVMTKTAQPFSMGAFNTLDFTVQGASGIDAFGTNAMDTIESKLVLWAGDGNSDRKIIYDGIANDRDPVFFDVITDPLNINSNYNHVTSGYYLGDYDMKGSSIYLGSGNDPDVIFFNVFLHPNNSTGSTIFIITEQIPR